MDILIKDGDHALDSRGLPQTLLGGSEAAQRAMIRLCVRKGSFALDKGLGSMLHTLSGADDALATSFVQDALSGMEGVQVGEVGCAYDSGDQSLRVNVRLNIDGERYTAQVSV